MVRLPVVTACLALALSGCGEGTLGDDDDDDDGDRDGGRDGDGGVDGDAPDDGPQCEAASGTRLRQVVLEASEGVRVVDGLFDAELEIACAPGRDGAGALRCLPSDIAGISTTFADAGCTQRLLLTSAAPTAAQRYGVSYASLDACTSVASYHPLLAATTITQGGTIYVGAPGACSAVPAQQGTYYNLGAAAADATFVELALESVRDDTRLDLRALTSADGMRRCVGELRDRELDLACAAAVAEDGVVRCLPSFAVQADAFSDAGCTAAAPVAFHQDACQPPPTRAGFVDPGFCAPRTALRSLGAPLATPVYVGAPGTCQQAALQPDDVVLPVGAAMTPIDFVALERRRRELGGRLDLVEHVAPDGLHLLLGSRGNHFFDRELGVACAFRPAQDSTLRCVPEATPEAPLADVVAFYVDDACTTSTRAATPTGVCAGEVPIHAVDFADRMYPIVGPHQGPLFGFDGVCAAADLAGLWAIGDEVELADLELATRVSE